MEYSRIKFIAERKKISLRQLCIKIGMSEQTFYKMLRNESTTVATLEKIAEGLDVPMSYLFGEHDDPEQTSFKKKDRTVHFDLEDQDTITIDMKKKKLEITKQ